MTAAEGDVLELTGERTPVRTLLGDVVRHRDLLVLMAKQDYSGRYRSASLGLAWSIGMPLLQGIVIAVVFSRLVGGGQIRTYIPYVLAGMAGWSFLQQSIVAGSTSIVDSGAIAGRIYFPRLLLPAIPATANLPSLVISLTIAEVIALITGSSLHLTLLGFPLVLGLAWLLVVAVGSLGSMAHVYSRDVRYIVQAGMLVLFYAAPIIYSLSDSGGRRALPADLRPFVLANPLTGVVQLSRWCITGGADYLGVSLIATGGWIVAFLAAVLVVYSRFERISVDRL